MLERGHSERAVARTLHRSSSTIHDEIQRNSVHGVYDATKADAKAKVRRGAAKVQLKKLTTNRELERFVTKALLKGHSPSAIAGRLKAGLEPGLPAISRDSIERYIASPYGRKLEYELKLLKQKQGRKKRWKMSAAYPDNRHGDPKVYIDDRPDVITNRERVGDLEIDFIISGKNGHGYALTATDRKLRVGRIRRVNPVTVGNAVRALKKVKRSLPGFSTMTTDNDILWRCHKQIEKELGITIYFCHPYSSWEKGSVEHFNKEARKYIRKGSDISQYSDAYPKRTETILNERYMGVLGYKTPNEVLAAYCKEQEGAGRYGMTCVSVRIQLRSTAVRVLGLRPTGARRNTKPVILFFDEMDALMPRRENSDSDVTRSVLSAILTEMDGLQPNDKIIVIGATNLPDAIDPAVARPGRMDWRVEVPQPDAGSRHEIISATMKKCTKNAGRTLFGEVDVSALAEAVDNISGAEIYEAIRRSLEAKVIAGRPLDEWVTTAEIARQLQLVKSETNFKKSSTRVGFGSSAPISSRS